MSEDSSLDQEAGSVREQRPCIHPHRNLAFPSFGGPGRGNRPFFWEEFNIQHIVVQRAAQRLLSRNFSTWSRLTLETRTQRGGQLRAGFLGSLVEGMQNASQGNSSSSFRKMGKERRESFDTLQWE